MRFESVTAVLTFARQGIRTEFDQFHFRQNGSTCVIALFCGVQESGGRVIGWFGFRGACKPIPR
jgi:hypothetical protein